MNSAGATGRGRHDVFVAYEGFELIANTAQDVRHAAKTLPRAYYTAVGFVIALYVLVSLERDFWGQPILGLLISAGLTLIVANIFDLTSIATLGSAGFLFTFAAVNIGNARHARHTNSRGWISATGAAACIAALAALLWQTAETAPAKLWVLAGMVGLAVLIEGGYRMAKR